MSLNNASRRKFLRTASVVSGSVGTAAAPFALNLATLGSAVAQTAGPYKAIVCLFMYGGNDSSHMVLRTDKTSFDVYTKMRNTGSDPIALLAPGTPVNNGATRASPARLGGVTPLTPKLSASVLGSTENSAFTFAVHPSMPEVANLFGAGRLAILSNEGPLVAPMTKAQWTANSVPRPRALGSHNDQQSTWQALGPEGVKVGWGGHLGRPGRERQRQRHLHQHLGLGQRGVLRGRHGVPVPGRQRRGGADRRADGLAVQLADGRRHVEGHRHGGQPEPVRRRIHQHHQALGHGAGVVPDFVRSLGRGRADDLHPAFGGQCTAKRPGAATPDGRPHHRRAQCPGHEPADLLRVDGGFDTHSNQNMGGADLLARVSHAIGYFDTVLSNLGGVDMRNNVTLFTASDFGRTLNSNGDGTDHGWVATHFVSSGAVNGGEIYGRFHEFGPQGIDSIGDRYLPIISVDQIGAAVGKWFGASSSQLNTIFPNLPNFATADLGFLK